MEENLDAETIFDVTFVAMTPQEYSGQLAWAGTRNDAIDALENHLLGLYGPKRFKITHIEEAKEISDSNPIRIPASPFMSKAEH